MNNFTPRASKVLTEARNEAGRLKHNYVGTEHLLLGLIAVGEGTGVSALQNLGVTLESLRSDVEKQIGVRSEASATDITPYTQQYTKALELARKEAKGLNQSFIGTQHILLGLLRERDAVIAAVFDARNVDIKKVRREIIRQYNPDFDSEMAEHMTPIYTRELLEEYKRTRNEITKKIKAVLEKLNALDTNFAQLRADVLKGNN